VCCSIETGTVADLAAARLGDLVDGLPESHQRRAGELVELANVSVLRQRRDRHVGDVVRVDERSRCIAGR
jgi:hypothetical protein